MTNGTLYANGDRVFPPSLAMQLHAPRYSSERDSRLDRHDVQLSYSLEARPLSTEEAGTTNIVRIRVEVLDLNGEPVTPNAVVLDLGATVDGSHNISRIRLTPGRGLAEGRPHRHHHGHKPWHWKFWQHQVDALLGEDFEGRPGYPPPHPPPHHPHGPGPHPPPPPPHFAPHPHGPQPHPPPPPPPPHHPPPPPGTPGAPSAEDDEDSDQSVANFYPPSPYWFPPPPPHHRHPHHRHGPHGHRRFMRLLRPVILPAILGTASGLIACVVGFFVGHLFLRLWRRCGGSKRKARKQIRRSRTVRSERGTRAEKSRMLSDIPETDSEGEAGDEAEEA